MRTWARLEVGAAVSRPRPYSRERLDFTLTVTKIGREWYTISDGSRWSIANRTAHERNYVGGLLLTLDEYRHERERLELLERYVDARRLLDSKWEPQTVGNDVLPTLVESIEALAADIARATGR